MTHLALSHYIKQTPLNSEKSPDFYLRFVPTANPPTDLQIFDAIKYWLHAANQEMDVLEHDALADMIDVINNAKYYYTIADKLRTYLYSKSPELFRCH